MADRRMMTRKVTDDDHFMALSASAQALYLHMLMAADDDGFCNQVTVCMFKAHASISDLQSLLEQRYIYQFENGVIVIKHWRMANALRKDRYTPTAFQKELAMLQIEENGAYTMQKDDSVAVWLPDGCQMVATDKDSIDKDSIGKDSICKIEKHKHGEYKNVLLTDDEYSKLKAELSNADEYIEKLSGYIASTGKSYKSHYATIRNWANKDQKDKPKETKASYDISLFGKRGIKYERK